MKQISRSLFCMVLLIISWYSSVAQETPEMADTMRSNGKIYVVVAVCLTILTGLFLYLVRIDRKISKVEKEQHHR